MTIIKLANEQEPVTPVAKRPIFQIFEVNTDVRNESTNRTPAQRLVSELADYKAQPIASGVPVLEYWEKSK